MGKRSTFPRLAKDHYPTIDPRAVAALLPHLQPGVRYAEPFAGEGHLIRQLDGHAELAWACDIDPREDPRIEQADGLAADARDAVMFISNPPWSRPFLHRAIVRLSNQLPSWLLFDSGWANTKQAAPFMPRCRKIVAVGRLIWIEGTRMQGKEDVSFYLFDRPIPGSAPVFYGRGLAPPALAGRQRRTCADCHLPMARGHKWSLQPRGGLATPVHYDCTKPTTRGVPPPPGPAPLLDWIGHDQTPLPPVESPASRLAS